MKRLLCILVLFSMMFLLVSCDYPEKSFQALSKDALPMEVNNNFNLPIGVYAPFEWTSNNAAITIDGSVAIVTQSGEDVLVTLTATINKTSRSFEVLVLKEGGVTVYEKAENAQAYLDETYEQLTSEVILMPKELEGLYIRYSVAYSHEYVGFYSDEENNTYLSNNFKAATNKVIVGVYYYKDLNFETFVSYYALEVLVDPMEENNPFKLAFNELNVQGYNYSDGLITIENVRVNDIIEFKETNEIDYLLAFFPEYVQKVSYNKLKIIKAVEEGSVVINNLYITIGNMTKNISIKLIMTS